MAINDKNDNHNWDRACMIRRGVEDLGQYFKQDDTPVMKYSKGFKP